MQVYMEWRIKIMCLLQEISLSYRVKLCAIRSSKVLFHVKNTHAWCLKRTVKSALLYGEILINYLGTDSVEQKQDLLIQLDHVYPLRTMSSINKIQSNPNRQLIMIILLLLFYYIVKVFRKDGRKVSI